MPAGTRVMPRTANPTTEAMTPSQRQGQYARGAASVSAATAGEETYAAPAPAVSPDSGERGGKVAPWAVLAVVLVVLFCLGGGWLLLQSKARNQPPATLPAPTTATSTTTSPPTATAKPSRPKQTTAAPSAPAPKTHFIECAKAIGKDADTVRQQLEDSNYTVKVSNDQPGGKKGRVASISPCGSQPEETEVTLHVFTGNDATTPDPGGSCNPADPGNLASCPPRP
jgi:hypothetical protein